MLPDDALLIIFFLYKEFYTFDLTWWEPLVHVCRRWRHIIFASPLHLNLTVVCNSRTPASKSLDIWPPFPISVHFSPGDPPGDIEDAVAAMEHHGRVVDIRLNFLTRFDFMRFSITMNSPFSALTYLSIGAIGSIYDDEFVLPDGFLGGSAPSLRTLLLERVAFPALPKLLLSTTHLSTLRLSSIPIVGYISPDVMATCLVTSNLTQLAIEFPFQLRFHHTDRFGHGPPLSTRALLPSLTSFHFNGDSNYLEDLLSQIDAPLLQNLSVTFCDHLVHIPQMLKFIGRTERLGPPIRVVVDFDLRRVLLMATPSNRFEVAITCHHSIVQVFSMISRELSPHLSRVEHLDLHCTPHRLTRQFVNSRRWLELFRPFISVTNLYVSSKLWSQVAPALRLLAGKRATEVFPELQTLLLEQSSSCSAQASIEPFIDACRHFDRPVTVRQCLALDLSIKD